MVIRLLGLLSEDEKLRAALMRFPDKLIEFLALTLNRGAVLCQSKSDDDDGGGGLEVQSLTTALSLMSYLVRYLALGQSYSCGVVGFGGGGQNCTIVSIFASAPNLPEISEEEFFDIAEVKATALLV